MNALWLYHHICDGGKMHLPQVATTSFASDVIFGTFKANFKQKTRITIHKYTQI